MVHKKGFVGPIQEAHPPTQISNAQKKCEARGGRWENGICFEADKVEPPPKIILKDGRPSGVELPSGRTLLGLGRQETLSIAQRRTPFIPPIGTVEAEAFGREQEQQRRNILLAEQVGAEIPIGELQPTELAGTEQTLLVAQKGAVDLAITRGLQFAGTAAAAGIVGTGGTLSVPLAAAGAAVGIVFGAIEGFYRARSDSITSQARGYEGEKSKIFKSGKTLLTRSLSNAWSGRGDKEDTLLMFNKNGNDMLRAWEQLQVDTQNDVQLRRGVDGTVTLAMYREFFKSRGQWDAFQDELRLAFTSAPNIERSIFWTNQADIKELEDSQ